MKRSCHYQAIVQGQDINVGKLIRSECCNFKADFFANFLLVKGESRNKILVTPLKRFIYISSIEANKL